MCSRSCLMIIIRDSASTGHSVMSLLWILQPYLIVPFLLVLHCLCLARNIFIVARFLMSAKLMRLMYSMSD